MRNLRTGDRVRLIRFSVDNTEHDDNRLVPSGTLGTVTVIDSAGTAHVTWDNGSYLGLLPDVDRWELVPHTEGPTA